MPRKVSQPPPILAIQSLSTGKRLDLVDDFTREEISHKHAGPLPSGNELLRAKREAEVEEQRKLLQHVGILPKPKAEPKPSVPTIPGMRPVGKLGDNRALYVPLPPWRRW